MSEDRRWRDDPGLDAELRALLDAGAAELPHPEQLERLEARLMPLIGPGGGGGGGSGAGGGASAAAKGLAGAAVKGLAIVGALVIAGGVAVWSATRESADASPVPAPSLAPISVTQPDPTSAIDGVPSGVDPPPDPVSAARPGPTSEDPLDRGTERASGAPRVELGPDPSTASDRTATVAPDPLPDPAAELALIDAAEAARASSPARALSLADEHASRFPDGTFAQEREVIAIDALLRLDREDDARARGARFGARWPGSAHRRRIEVLLGAP